MSDPAASDCASSALPRLRIHHLLVLMAIFSIVMAAMIVLLRSVRQKYPNAYIPETEAFSSFLVILCLVDSICFAVCCYGLAWRKREISFPSEPGHWAAVYVSIGCVYSCLLYLWNFPVLFEIGEINERIIFWMLRGLALAYQAILACLMFVAYQRETVRIWKWGWAAMAIKAALRVAFILFLLLVQLIDWIIEIYWYYDWQLFRYWDPFPILPLKLVLILPQYLVLGFLVTALTSDIRHRRPYHWSHWLVLATLLVSVINHLIYYHAVL